MSNKKTVPTYRHHKQSGQAIVTLTDGFGNRRDVLLGKFGTAESRSEYLRVLAEWEAAGRTLGKPTVASDLTVNELIEAFWKHAEQHYRRPDGTPTHELEDFRLTLRTLKRLYGFTPAREFGPLALKAVRQAMITSSWLSPEEKVKYQKLGRPLGLCRGVTNQRIGRIRRLFKWAVENELVAPSVHHGLMAVRGLQKRRTEARETEPVHPVARGVVEGTLAHLRPMLADMVSLQLESGMRPGELVIMRSCDIDMTGKTWLYYPERHKTEHHGHRRVVPLGPKAQEIVRRYLKVNTQAYLFSPAENMEERCQELREKRKTPVQPSQRNRKKKRLRRKPGDRYAVGSYGKAIAKACTEAFPPPEHLRQREGETKMAWLARLTEGEKAELEAWHKTHRWHPHQLRHTRATELRRELGLDVARAVLGHRSPQVTELYAELDLARAAEAMAKMG